MIFRRQHQSKFTAISNAICVNKGISTDARWCIWYLLTKPVDWVVRPADIQAVSGWGRDKTHRVIAELVAANYLTKSQERDESGQFDTNRYDVHEEPFTGSPSTENPSTDYPSPENKALTKDLELPKTDKVQKTEKNISYDADFDEFWAAYPKRLNNPKKPAKLKYMAARKRGVSHETIMQGLLDYAKTREGEDPKFTKLAETWLNKECWQDDYSVYGSKPSQVADNIQQWLDEIIAAYPGHVGDRAEAAKLISVELAKGTTGRDLWDAARKYKLFCKGPPYEDRKIAPAMLEVWLKFKWREMDAYEFCTVGPERIKSVRIKKVAA